MLVPIRGFALTNPDPIAFVPSRLANQPDFDCYNIYRKILLPEPGL